MRLNFKNRKIGARVEGKDQGPRFQGVEVSRVKEEKIVSEGARVKERKGRF